MSHNGMASIKFEDISLIFLVNSVGFGNVRFWLTKKSIVSLRSTVFPEGHSDLLAMNSPTSE